MQDKINFIPFYLFHYSDFSGHFPIQVARHAARAKQERRTKLFLVGCNFHRRPRRTSSCSWSARTFLFVFLCVPTPTPQLPLPASCSRLSLSSVAPSRTTPGPSSSSRASSPSSWASSSVRFSPNLIGSLFNRSFYHKSDGVGGSVQVSSLVGESLMRVILL